MKTRPHENVSFVKCFICGCDIEVDASPGFMQDLVSGKEHFVVPKLKAPFVCGECRKDPGKFMKAHKAMFKYFGWPWKEERQ